MEGIFVTGVDTSVGKTIVCAGMLKAAIGGRKVAYWKPVQTGTIVSDDTATVRSLVDATDDCFLDPVYRFADPVSPHFAALKWGKRIDLDEIVRRYEEARKRGITVILEGAGGMLVPLNDKDLQADLIERVKLPVLLVATDRVGAINQTLLSLNECRERNIAVAGVILTKSRGHLGNAEAISTFGKVEVLAEIAPSDDSRTLVAAVSGNDRVRKLLGVPSLPL